MPQSSLPLNKPSFTVSGIVLLAVFAGLSIQALAATSNLKPKVRDDRRLSVIEISTGQTIVLATLDGKDATRLGVGARYRVNAEFGKVEDDGTYHAPLFVPPSGLDLVTICDTDGAPVARLIFQVNPGLKMVAPGSQIPGMLTSAPVKGPFASPANGSSRALLVENDSPTAIADLKKLSVVSTSLGRAYPLPVRAPVELGVDRPILDNPIVALSSVRLVMGKKGGVFPKPSYEGRPSTSSGTRTVSGPWKSYRLGLPTSITKPSTFSDFHPTTYLVQAANRVQFTDVYSAQNGVWTFDHTTKCTVSGVFKSGFVPAQTSKRIGAGYSWDSATQECERF